MEVFPSHRRLPRAMLRELKNVYNSGTIGMIPCFTASTLPNSSSDVITSDVSMFSYDTDTAHQLLKTVDRLDKGILLEAPQQHLS